jgi:hypothetical protein
VSEVVFDLKQDVTFRPESDEGPAHRRSVHEVELVSSYPADQVGDRTERGHHVQLRFDLGRHPLHGDTVIVLREPGANSGVAGDHRRERRAQPGHVQDAVEGDPRERVVPDGTRCQQFHEPDGLLLQGQRHVVLRRVGLHLGGRQNDVDGGLARRGRRSVQQDTEPRHTRIAEQLTRREIMARAAQAIEEPRRTQGVPSQLEEAVLDTDFIQFQGLGEERRDLRFGIGARPHHGWQDEFGAPRERGRGWFGHLVFSLLSKE